MEIPVFLIPRFFLKTGVLQESGKITTGYPEPDCRYRAGGWQQCILREPCRMV